MKRKKSSLIIISLLFAIVVTACGNPSNQADQQELQEEERVNQGDLAPMFDLKDVSDDKVALADFAGEKVYVKYWASWCSICLAGLDELDKLAGLDNDFQIITIVNPDYNGEQSAEEFRQWFETLATENLRVLFDNNGKWAEKFGVLAYPTSYYIGSDGVLVNAVTGHNPNDMITSEMEKIN